MRIHITYFQWLVFISIIFRIASNFPHLYMISHLFLAPGLRANNTPLLALSAESTSAITKETFKCGFLTTICDLSFSFSSSNSLDFLVQF